MILTVKTCYTIVRIGNSTCKLHLIRTYIWLHPKRLQVYRHNKIVQMLSYSVLWSTYKLVDTILRMSCVCNHVVHNTIELCTGLVTGNKKCTCSQICINLSPCTNWYSFFVWNFPWRCSHFCFFVAITSLSADNLNFGNACKYGEPRCARQVYIGAESRRYICKSDINLNGKRKLSGN